MQAYLFTQWLVMFCRILVAIMQQWVTILLFVRRNLLLFKKYMSPIHSHKYWRIFEFDFFSYVVSPLKLLDSLLQEVWCPSQLETTFTEGPKNYNPTSFAWFTSPRGVYHRVGRKYSSDIWSCHEYIICTMSDFLHEQWLQIVVKP